MDAIEPIYTDKNCSAAFQLNWSLSLFWKAKAIDHRLWFEELLKLTETDGVRILEYRRPAASTSQFLISTLPLVIPSEIIRSVKGRLQHLIRDSVPTAFYRNYSLVSIGSSKCDVVQNYVASQLDHHPLVDARLVDRFRQYQIYNPAVDLNLIRRSSHGEFCNNLHLVFEYEKGYREFRHEMLMRIRDMLQESSRKKQWLLSRAGILPDHLHLTVGCWITDSPLQVALSCLNDLAELYGMKPVWKFGFYAGSFGPFDLGAVWTKQDAIPDL